MDRDDTLQMASDNPSSLVASTGQPCEKLNGQRSLYNECLSYHQKANVCIIESSSCSTQKKIQEESTKNLRTLETPHQI